MSNFIQAGNATNNGTIVSSDTSGILLIQSGSSGTTAITIDANQNSAFAGTVKMATYTVAALPSAGAIGRRAIVTNALAPTFLTSVVGGGAIVVPVYDNGTAWVVG